MDETCNQIIYLLLDREHAVPYAIINHETKTPERRKFMDSAIIELERLNIINKSFDSGGLENYRILQPLKIKIRNLPRQFENNPYGYFLDEERKESEAESAYKWYLRSDAKQRFDDYPIVKRQKNNAVILAVITTLSTIVLGLLQIKCNH